MTTEEITVGNKLIAEFMEASPLHHDNKEHGFYHNSWGWLMPVVIKIVNMDIEFRIIDLETSLYGSKQGVYFCSDDGKNAVADVHGIVVEFIKWLNLQPK